MRSVSALAIALSAGLGGPGAAGFDVNAILDFQAAFTPVMVQRAGSEADFMTQPIIPPGLASASVGIDVHSWQGKVSASSSALGTMEVLQVDYLARYVAYTFTKSATPPGMLPPPANAIKAEGCFKVTWPEGVLPPPPSGGEMEQIPVNTKDAAHITVDGEKCIADPHFGQGHDWFTPAFDTKDSHLVALVGLVPMMEQSGMIPPPVEQAIPPGVEVVGLKFSDYESPMEPLKEPTCVEGQEAAAIEALADPRRKAFVAALEAHFQMVSRVVGGRSGRHLPVVNLTQALLSARRSTAISLKESDDGSSWMTAAFAIVALVGTVAAAAFAAGARTRRRAEAPGYQNLLA